MSKIGTSGIIDGQIVYSEHVLRIINAFTAVTQSDILINGSVNITGSSTFYGTSSFYGGATVISNSLIISPSNIFTSSTATRILLHDTSSGIIYTRDLNGISSQSLTIGLKGQIPFVNSSNNDLSYSNNVSYNTTGNILKIGTGISIVSGSGINDNNFYLGLNHTDSASVSGVNRWNFVLGEQHLLINDANSGFQSIADSFILGAFFNKLSISSSGGNLVNSGIVGSLNSMIRTYDQSILQGGIIVGGTQNSISPTQSNGTGDRIQGNFILGGSHNISDGHGSGIIGGYWGRSSGAHSLVHGYVTTFIGGGWGGPDVTFNPDISPAHTNSVFRIIANGKHAVNISANSPSQSSGSGANADYSGILFGFDHHIPSESLNSAIVGGNAILADSGSINTVYFPKIKIGRGLTASLPTIISASTILGRVNNDGEIGNITIGSNLTLISGTLSSTGGSINTGSFSTTGSNNFIGTEVITGSLIVSGGSNFIKSSITSSIISGSQFTGSLFGSASYSLTSSFAQNVNLSGSNGLTKSGSNFILGGAVTKDTLISMTSSNNDIEFTFDQSESNLGGISILNYGLNQQSGFQFGTVEDRTLQRYSTVSSFGTSTAIAFNGNTRNFSLQMDWVTENAVFSDSAGKGIEYESNYSSSFTSRSLVDKGYVDGKYLKGNFTTSSIAITSFVVPIGLTLSNTNYVVTTEAQNLLSSPVHYISAKSNTTFTVTYASGLTGTVNFDWVLFP